MRRSDIFFAFIAINLILLIAFFSHSFFKQIKSDFTVQRAIVRSLGLTDLCLFTEARYTRHLSMADLNTPFQDYPLSFEHFPSGALIKPPSRKTSEL
ncbi:hypothetical protein JZK55_19580 [Dissulfurispira thermophila]|uniref:Uncharacterized protein n=1 Tax=Dissulfurispira thermophila TaxID=2715679 RepID=A0A7G1H545_9BACT|nr:hypothetical protein [Dissulfurispira thermophila]BCB97036.1 hypothetical protein JZK55_19580 [Dissulfurispira thermophila]